MQRKELVLVAIGTIVLTNVSIVGTLFAYGYFSTTTAAEKLPSTAAEQAKEMEVTAARPHSPALRSMSQAMLMCEDKVVESNEGKNIGFDVNSVASRYLEDEHLYQVFIDTKTASRVGSPQESAEVSCEVAADSMTIVGYREMKN